jgi:predicted MPP superfamily phosphohydrolase
MDRPNADAKTRRHPREKRRGRWWRIALILLTALILYSMIESSNPVTNRVTLADADVPAAFDGYKIVFVADVHYGPFLTKEQLNALIEKINKEDADLVLLGGDYIRYDTRDFVVVENAFKGIRAKDGVYGVLGNHDIWNGSEAALKCFADDGITDLDNASARIEKGGQNIVLSGAAEAQYGHPDVPGALGGISENDLNIFVTHNPLLFANGAQKSYTKYIDLALMGHTHGGQISFFGLFSFWNDEFAEFYRPAIREREGLKYILTNGYGTSVVPFRFFVPPQMHVITLKRI